MINLPNEEKPRTRKKMKRWVLVLIIVAAVLLSMILALFTAYGVLYFSGKHSLTSHGEFSVQTPSGFESDDGGQNVKDQTTGEKYVYNHDKATFLVIGTDKVSFDEESSIGLNGQADALFLVVLDLKTTEVDVISISRESMTDVDVFSQNGDFVRLSTMQLCLSYAYGDGRHTSCENVVRATSRLLNGIPIDAYLAIDLDAISVLTDAVDGVTVPEYTDDLTTTTGAMVTLDGKQATKYVRTRDYDAVDANNARIERQTAFIRSFVARLVEKTKKDLTTPVTIYNALSPYMITDITAGEVTYLATNYISGAEHMEMRSVPGQVVMGERFAEFHTDRDALYQMLLDIFYIKQ